MKKYILTLILILCSNLFAGELFNDTLPIAGKVYYNWYFGGGAQSNNLNKYYGVGMSFNTFNKEPIFIGNTNLGGGENTSTISDKYGNYLLHTNGKELQGRNFNILDSKYGLHISQSEGIVVAPLKADKFIEKISTNTDVFDLLSNTLIELNDINADLFHFIKLRQFS